MRWLLIQRRAHGSKHVPSTIDGYGFFGLLIRVFDEFLGQFEQEARGMARSRLAEFFARMTMAQGQSLHGSGNGDIEEAPFLIQSALDFRTGMRQQPILHPHDIDVWKFKSLAAMHRD